MDGSPNSCVSPDRSIVETDYNPEQISPYEEVSNTSDSNDEDNGIGNESTQNELDETNTQNDCYDVSHEISTDLYVFISLILNGLSLKVMMPFSQRYDTHIKNNIQKASGSNC